MIKSEINRRYYLRNRERILYDRKERYCDNTEKELEYSRAYKDKNRISMRKKDLLRYEINYYGRSRKIIFDKDGNKCVLCKSQKKLIVHHRDGNGTSTPIGKKNNSIDNLVTLCSSCHTKVHRSKTEIVIK